MVYRSALLALATLSSYVVWPLIGHGYFGDDLLNSMIPMHMRFEHLAYWDYVFEQAGLWISNAGRFFPASIAESTLVFRVFDTPMAYNVFQLAAVVTTVLLLVTLIARLTDDRALGIAAGVFMVMCLQIRNWHDPILSFSAQQSIVLSLVLLSALLFLDGVKNRRRWSLLASSLPWAAAILTYESTLLLFPLFLVLAMEGAEPLRERAGRVLWVLVPTILLGAVFAAARLQASAPGAGYSLDLSPGRVLPTFGSQILAAIPLSYSAVNVPDFIEPISSAWEVSWGDVLMVALTAAVVAGALMTARWHATRTVVAVAALGLLLLVAPALVPSLTERWQNELRPGLGYVPVYLQYSGSALLCTGVAALLIRVRLRGERIARRVTGLVLVGLVVLVALVVQMTHDNNRRAVAATRPAMYPRETFEAALEHGVFRSVEPGSAMVAMVPEYWTGPWFISWFEGPRVEVLNDALSNGWNPPCPAVDMSCYVEHRPDYAFSIVAFAEDSGYVAVAEVDTAIDEPAGLRVLTRSVTLYVLSRDDPSRLLEVEGGGIALTSIADVPGAAPSLRVLEDDEVTIVDRGPGWILLLLEPASGWLMLDQIDISG